MPLAVTANGGKSIIKGMVQGPTDYSVGLNPEDYAIWALTGRAYLGYEHAYARIGVYYLPDWVFWRLPAPGNPQ